MACFHPLRRWVTGTNIKSGKSKGVVTSYDYAMLDPFTHDYMPVSESQVIPCGQCIGCRLDYSRQWADRCMLELQYHDSAYFVTLTYDDEHVPITFFLVNEETGEAGEAMTLVKKDVQDFLKRLRKHFGYGEIRYYCAGEYGSKLSRPHYHLILFGLKLDDLIPFRRVNGYTYYRSPTIEQLWTYGFSLVGACTWEACAYTARYVTKKLNGDLAKIYDYYNMQPEFSLMSRKPGLGARYFEEHELQLYEFDKIYIAAGGKSLSIRPPRYYDRKFDIDYPEDFAKIKEKRQVAFEDRLAIELERTNLTYLEYLAVKERQQVDRAKKLNRRLENETK